MVTAGRLECPGCGGALELRGGPATVTVACQYCGAVIDAKTREVAEYKSALDRCKPLIPLGRRGTIGGAEFEAIGFMRRKVRYYGVDYEWSEYLLYNPFKGYRWLVEDQGHWTLFETLQEQPT